MEEFIYVTRDFVEDVIRTKLQKKIVVLYDNGNKSGEIKGSYTDRNHLFLIVDPDLEIEDVVKNYYKKRK